MRHRLPHRVAAQVRAEMVRQDQSVLGLAAVLGVGVEDARSRYDGTCELGLEELRAVARWLSVPVARLTAGLDEGEADPPTV